MREKKENQRGFKGLIKVRKRFLGLNYEIFSRLVFNWENEHTKALIITGLFAISRVRFKSKFEFNLI